jgi:hypothetical protein
VWVDVVPVWFGDWRWIGGGGVTGGCILEKVVWGIRQRGCRQDSERCVVGGFSGRVRRLRVDVWRWLRYRYHVMVCICARLGI